MTGKVIRRAAAIKSLGLFRPQVKHQVDGGTHQAIVQSSIVQSMADGCIIQFKDQDDR